MKTKKYLNGLTGLLVLSIVAVGCKKEVVPAEFESISFDAAEVLEKLPVGLTSSNDASAKECVGFIESALDMTLFIDNMKVPEDAQKSAKKSTSGADEWHWSWHFGGESFTFYWTYDEDASRKNWSMDIQFGAGPRYDYVDAWESKDGGEGEVMYNFTWAYIYSGESMEDYEALFWKYTWELDNSGAYKFNWFYESEDLEYNYYLHYDITINPDGSGTIDYYSMDALFYQSEWDVLGKGSWTYYLGDFEQSGIWTVG